MEPEDLLELAKDAILECTEKEKANRDKLEEFRQEWVKNLRDVPRLRIALAGSDRTQPSLGSGSQ